MVCLPYYCPFIILLLSDYLIIVIIPILILYKHLLFQSTNPWVSPSPARLVLGPPPQHRSASRPPEGHVAPRCRQPGTAACATGRPRPPFGSSKTGRWWEHARKMLGKMEQHWENAGKKWKWMKTTDNNGGNEDFKVLKRLFTNNGDIMVIFPGKK